MLLIVYYNLYSFSFLSLILCTFFYISTTICPCLAPRTVFLNFIRIRVPCLRSRCGSLTSFVTCLALLKLVSLVSFLVVFSCWLCWFRRSPLVLLILRCCTCFFLLGTRFFTIGTYTSNSFKGHCSIPTPLHCFAGANLPFAGFTKRAVASEAFRLSLSCTRLRSRLSAWARALQLEWYSPVLSVRSCADVCVRARAFPLSLLSELLEYVLTRVCLCWGRRSLNALTVSALWARSLLLLRLPLLIGRCYRSSSYVRYVNGGGLLWASL